MTLPVRNISGKHSKRTRPGQAWVAAIVILVVGAVLGYLFSKSISRVSSAADGQAAQSNRTTSTAQGQIPLDVSIRPLLDRLKSNPNDPALLANIGDRYYDHQDWSDAVRYFRRSLKSNPGNVNVRTDMGTAIWYGGDPEDAIREYKTALTYAPDYPQTLFNLGVVEWQGEHNDRAALKSWRKLLRVHPEYSARDKVEQLIQRVQAELNQSGASAGTH